MASTVMMSERAVNKQSDGAHPVGVLLIVLGVALMIAGIVMLVYLGMTVLDILKSPEDAELVALLLEQTKEQGQAFFGTFGDNKVEFTLGEPLRMVLLILVLLWILGAVLRIIGVIIGVGRDLVADGRQR
ncbi:MAG: hypothetical protein ACR2QJ_15070 [Geminicoccaceae bacterium]